MYAYCKPWRGELALSWHNDNVMGSCITKRWSFWVVNLFLLDTSDGSLIGQRPLWCPSFTKGSRNVHVIVTMTTEACLRARTGLHFLSSWLVHLDARTKKENLFFYKSSDPLYPTAVICVVWPLWTIYCVVLSEVVQWKSVHIYENTQSNILYDVCVFESGARDLKSNFEFWNKMASISRYLKITFIQTKDNEKMYMLEHAQKACSFCTIGSERVLFTDHI